ncbi:hypothetical protein VKS41_008372 [Umbelopsis sp. WA50703]|jgi:hypothetical protein
MLRFTQLARQSTNHIRHYATKSKTTNVTSKARVPTEEQILPDGSIFITRLPLSTPETSKAAPLLHKAPQDATKRLGAAEVEELRQLRAQDPSKWTRKALAQRYGCSEFFVSIAAGKKQPPTHKAEQVLSDAGYRKKIISDNRVKRRALW